MVNVTKINRQNKITKARQNKITKAMVSRKVVNSKINRQNKITKASVSRRVVNSKIRGLGVDTSKFRYNQSPVETPNGVIVIFTLPNSDEFVTGLIEVFINGNQKIKDTEWEETGTTQITLIGGLASTPPTSGESIKLNYIKK